MSTNTTTTTTTASPAILIPTLPNDIALQCLARVPRRYHSVLSAVSKPIRSLLSSPQFFAVRSSLNCSEHLLYLCIRGRDWNPARWFTVYETPNPNDNNNNNKSNIIMAPVPGLPNAQLDWLDSATVGHKIYILGGKSDGRFSTDVWSLDCQFHTWESGPSMPVAPRGGSKTIVLDGKIYMIECETKEDSWVSVFDTVAGRWKALRSPKLGIYKEPVFGCGIRGGKVCVWLEREELRFDPATKTWEVFESSVGLGLHWSTQMCDVNGVLYCSDDYSKTIKGFDERIGVWKELNFLNNRGLLLNQLRKPRMVALGGRLVIMGLGYMWDEFVTSDLSVKLGVWCGEIEVKKDGNGDFEGEVLWSEMVYFTFARLIDRVPLFFSCMPVSL